MKKVFILILVSIFCTSLFAQTSGGPDPYGYRWKSSLDTVSPPAFNWIDITTTGTLVSGLGDDNYVGPFTGSNGFQYYWYNTSQYYIGSNGFISFNGVNIASPFPATIPDPLGANDYIAPLLSDLNFAGSGNPGKCYTYSNVDTLIVSYIDVPFWSAGINFTGKNTFQIILDKNDNSITFNYLETDLGVGTSIDDIVGIENVTGTLGLRCFVDTLPGDSLTIKFTYPSTVTYQAIDASVNWVNNDETGGIFIKAGATPIPHGANVRNNGNQNVSSFTVYDTLYNTSGTAIGNGSASIGTLIPGQDSSFSFSDSLGATTPGRYTLAATLDGLTGDLVFANNRLPLEVIAIDTNKVNMSLEYSDGNADGGGLGWTGGGGGIAIYIEPPIYPAKVKDTRFYLTSLGIPAVGFHSILYDDDGPGGGPGTVLDSVFTPPNNLVANNYEYVKPSKQVIIDSGGVYLLWLMDGPGINLGRDLTPPFSRRTYEVLFGSWSGYRDRLTEDFLLGMRVTYAFPRANFNINESNDPTFVFTDRSSNGPTSWFWEFGDGATDTVQNPSHTYMTNDTFNVCLTASNQYGSDSVCKSVVVDGLVPTADFTIDDSGMPLIRFFDASTNSPTAWFWDFGASPADTANTQNISFRYNANGTYNVCLTAKNKNGPSIPYCQDVEITGIGIEEFSEEDVQVFPNPFTDQMQIRFDGEINASRLSINLYDMLGKEMQAVQERNGNELILYRGNLPKGTYVLEVQEDKAIRYRTTIQVGN